MPWRLLPLLAAAALLRAGDVDTARLDALRDSLAARRTKALLIIRRDKVIYEWHAPGSGPTQLQGTASLAKALVGGMSLLVALNDGRLRPDDFASRFIPSWRDDPRRSRITIRHLATHSSGIEDAEENGIPHDRLPGWKGAFWRRDPDPFSIAIHQAPVIFDPGTRFAYSNTGMAALAYAVTAALGRDIESVLRERIMQPIGVPDAEWSIGYRHPYEVDGLKLWANWGGGAFTPRATARIARLMLRHGDWDGRRIVNREQVSRMLAPAGTPVSPREKGEPWPVMGLCWYNNSDGIWPTVPRDAFAGAGAQHQVLLAVPSLDLIVVRNGGTLTNPGDTEPFWTAVRDHLFVPLMDAFAPYPASPVIRGVKFAPVPDIARDAIESDNWPITWGDDGAQYTAYGDGWGFAPRAGRKLSLGLARVTGGPAQFHGENIPSATGERTGDGKAGLKTSGMLMVRGVLYMWVRNAGNAQLAWSEDHGRTWQWGFRFDTSFGSPAFLNFGENYAGARDGFVYIYSQDGPSAYESSDGIVLARVPLGRIRDRAAYEFFAGGKSWTADIARRRPVFQYAGHCQRVDAVYHPGLKRYLLAVGYNHEGGWGIFDAPEPWGPWTTAFHTADWGLGQTHGYRLPAKWIGPDRPHHVAGVLRDQNLRRLLRPADGSGSGAGALIAAPQGRPQQYSGVTAFNSIYWLHRRAESRSKLRDLGVLCLKIERF